MKAEMADPRRFWRTWRLWWEALSQDLASAPGPLVPAGAWLVAMFAGGAGGALLVTGLAGYQGGFLSINGWSSAFPPALWQALTLLGDEHLAIGLMLLVARRQPRLLWALCLTALAALVCTQALKHGLATARPPAVLPQGSFQLLGPALHKRAFPSGHTMLAFALAGAALFWLRAWSTRLLLVTLAALVGLSRIALGVHWPVDVLAGAALGALSAGMGMALARRWPLGPRPSVHLGIVLVGSLYPLGLLLGDDRGLDRIAPLLPWLGLLILVKVGWDYRWRPSRSR